MSKASLSHRYFLRSNSRSSLTSTPLANSPTNINEFNTSIYISSESPERGRPLNRQQLRPESPKSRASISTSMSSSSLSSVITSASEKHSVEKHIAGKPTKIVLNADDINRSLKYELETTRPFALAALRDRSPSPEALDRDPNVAEETAKKRLDANVNALASIASSAAPPARGFRELVEKARHMRKNDFETAPRNRIPEYSAQTKYTYRKIGEYMKRRTGLHNKLILEAMANSVTEADAVRGGIENYESTQGKIRPELLKEIQRVCSDVDIRHDLFRNPAIGRVAIESLTIRKVSGDPTKPRVIDAINHNQEKLTEKEGTRSELHHMAFKSAKDDTGSRYLEEFSLRPDNLELLHGERARNDGSVHKSQWGAHEWIHRGTGFVAGVDDKQAAAMGYGEGSHFDRIDSQAVKYVMEPILVPRTTKREMYNLTLQERIEAYANKQKDLGGSETENQLNNILRNMEKMRHTRKLSEGFAFSESEVEEYARGELGKTKIGRVILE